MTNGSRLLPGYVPSVDAVVTERLLGAGATIVGKMNMDSFGFGATSETSDFGSPRNPHNPAYSAGGSSGGSGAAVAAGDVDIAFGLDEGGSARIPASWCGVTCIKPTHGLVPSFGISYMDHTLDDICPMARSVEDIALALEVVAGEDPRDPQWVRGPIRVEEYSRTFRGSVAGLKAAVIKESMEWDESEPDVNEAVNEGIEQLKALGISVRQISIPWWTEVWPVIISLMCHSVSAMVETDLEGYWRGGLCDPGWQEAFGKARRAGSDGFPTLLKVWMILGKYLRQQYSSTYFSKAQNLRFAMSQRLDKVFEDVDMLISPTVPMKATKLIEEWKMGAWEGRAGFAANRNTCPFNLTGNPALSLPCGVGENGLPIGLQLAGRRFEESLLLRAGYAFECSARAG